MKLKLKIIGTKASLFLINKGGKIADESRWEDSRDLSEKLLGKIDKLLKRNNFTIKSISKVDFNCDSPYFKKNKKIDLKEIVSSKNKCGFTAWQTGEITAKVLNFALSRSGYL